MVDAGHLQQRRSLRAKLLVPLLVGVLLAQLAIAASTYLETRHEFDDLLDKHLAQTADLLVAQTVADMIELTVNPLPASQRKYWGVAFQVWAGGKDLLLRSNTAPAERMSSVEEGFSDVVLHGSNWRVYSTWAGDRKSLVQVAEERRQRDALVVEVVTSLLAPMIVALPLLALLLWYVIDRGLAPLRHIGSDIARRSPDNLSQLHTEDVPTEVVPLIDNLNRLFTRVGELMERERRFTADAAHELRTPLAALRSQAQVARAESDSTERIRALDNVIAACDRAARLVEQLLTLARLEPEEIRQKREPCDLARVAREAVADVLPFAQRRGVAIEIAGPDAFATFAVPSLMRVLLRNLVDNAARYSPAGGMVTVTLDPDANRIAVEDQGPGVPLAERARLGERFHRLLGSGQTGIGLGLSIVKRIAQIHDAAIAFDAGADGRGLRVTVTLAAPPQDSAPKAENERRSNRIRRRRRVLLPLRQVRGWWHAD
jgi:two-component system sensor histidine kinase QseC